MHHTLSNAGLHDPISFVLTCKTFLHFKTVRPRVSLCRTWCLMSVVWCLLSDLTQETAPSTPAQPSTDPIPLLQQQQQHAQFRNTVSGTVATWAVQQFNDSDVKQCKGGPCSSSGLTTTGASEDTPVCTTDCASAPWPFWLRHKKPSATISNAEIVVLTV